MFGSALVLICQIDVGQLLFILAMTLNIIFKDNYFVYKNTEYKYAVMAVMV